MYEQNTSMMNIPEQNAFLLPAMVEGDFSSEEIAEDADGLQMMSFRPAAVRDPHRGPGQSGLCPDAGGRDSL